MAAAHDAEALKRAIHAHWNAAPCGTRDLPREDRAAFFKALEAERYQLEPYIRDFARFDRGRGMRVLEVGIGAGTDFVNWVRAGAVATGIDLTERAVELTRERLDLEGLSAEVRVADAEALPFPDASFDIVYSYGVLHHTPDTARAVREIHRVLKPGGIALVMLHHLHSWVGAMLWTLHCLGKAQPWKGLRDAFLMLESPGTQAFTRDEARAFFSDFSHISLHTQLSHGDLLLMRPSEKYKSRAHDLLWQLYPRRLVRATGDQFGTALMIEAVR